MRCQLSVVSCQLVLIAVASAGEVASPLTPDESVKHFQLADASLKIELAACEPEVVDPVAIRFDEDGRMWVVEMRGFMPNTERTGEFDIPGRISILDDTDGDGRMDKKTIFLQCIPYIGYNPLLTLAAEQYIGFAPFVQGMFIFTEQT